jgi:hypothetical protein
VNSVAIFKELADLGDDTPTMYDTLSDLGAARGGRGRVRGFGDEQAANAWRPAVEELINGVWTRTWTGNYQFLSSDDAINFVKKTVGTPPTALLHSNESAYRIIAEQQAGTTPPVIDTEAGTPAVIASDGTKMTEGMLFRTSTNATVYVMQNGQKCPITGGGFSERGYNWGMVQTVSQAAADSVPIGATIYSKAEIAAQSAAATTTATTPATTTPPSIVPSPPSTPAPDTTPTTPSPPDAVTQTTQSNAFLSFMTAQAIPNVPNFVPVVVGVVGIVAVVAIIATRKKR